MEILLEKTHRKEVVEENKLLLKETPEKDLIQVLNLLKVC
jgi:hypothetical protein